MWTVATQYPPAINITGTDNVMWWNSDLAMWRERYDWLEWAEDEWKGGRWASGRARLRVLAHYLDIKEAKGWV